MRKLRLGVLGIGNMGTAHITNIQNGDCPEIAVTAVADRSPARLEWAAKRAPEAAQFSGIEPLLESGLIDALLICVPHYDHPRCAMAAMKRGFHVMVEKPAGVYTKAVREMNQTARDARVVFGMMFNQRTDPVYRKMRELVQGGKLGRIRRTNWIITDWYRPQAYFDSGAWRATWAGEGGGVLLNQCPHNLDLWQWICGMPVRVSAHMQMGKWHDIEVEDDVTCYAEYENGATGVFITSTGDAPGTNRFEITLDGGKLVAENGKLMLWQLAVHEPLFSRENKAPFGVPEHIFSEVKTDGESAQHAGATQHARVTQHAGVLNAFAKAILHGKPLVARGEEGINGLLLSNAMHLSAWTGKTVSIPFDEDEFYRLLMERVACSRYQPGNSVVADLTGTYGVR